jgi:NAD:arginine ADP-ribosyltransferase
MAHGGGAHAALDDPVENDPAVSDGDASFFDGLLDSAPLTDLLSAARLMHCTKVFHGARKRIMMFKFDQAMQMLQECIAWAKAEAPLDARAALSTEELAAIRAWTGSPLCYVVTSVLRAADRTEESVAPVLGFPRLFYEGLHKLPPRFLYVGALYRAEGGSRINWAAVMQPGNVFSFFAPTSSSSNAGSVVQFKTSDGDRTVYVVENGAGYLLKEFSLYATDNEVLVEGITTCTVVNAHNYDDVHPEVIMKERNAGLHHVMARVRPGTSLLAGSPARQRENVVR